MLQKTHSSTGAQTASREREQASQQVAGFVDYITCSFPDSQREDLIEFLGGDWNWAYNKKNGYKQSVRCGGIFLRDQGRFDMGVSLEVNGSGCRELEMKTITRGWRVFLGELLARGARFSRLDIALDDYTGLLSMAKIGRCCNAGLACCRFRSINGNNPNKPNPERNIASSYTFGSRESDTMVRIYNKALQQDTEEHHVRVELETKGRKAKELARKLSEEGENAIPGVIYKTLDFKVRGKGLLENRYKWKTQPWWKQFLGEAAKIRLSVAPGERTLEKSTKALAHQYGMTMAMIVRTYGPNRLLEIAAEGEIRLLRKRFKVKERREQRRDAC